MLTVKDLKLLLENFPEDLKIGRTGYFGEFNEMDEGDFHIEWDTSNGWNKRIAKWVSIIPPNIGPEPD